MQRVVRANQKAVGIALLLLCSLFILYFLLGSALGKTTAFNVADLLFELDVNRGIDDLAYFPKGHYRTSVHPIYVLLVNPWGSLLNSILDSEVTAAVALNAFMGALGVAMAFVFFYLYGGRLVNSALLALVFGFSMSQVLLSAIPDTSSLAICSLLFTYILFWHGLQKRELSFKWWVVAGVFTLGVTITNLAQTFICFTILTYLVNKDEGPLPQVVKKSLGLGISVIGIAGILSLVQKLIYPTSRIFLQPAYYAEEVAYSSLFILKEPLIVVGQLLKHFFVIDFVAPFPDVYSIPGLKDQAVTFASSWRYSQLGWIAVSLWVILLVGGSLDCLGMKKMRPFYLGILCCLLFNGLLHSVYGVGEKGKIEYFLYSGNVTFLVMTLLGPYARSQARTGWVWLLAVIILMGMSNLEVFQNLLSVYQ